MNSDNLVSYVTTIDLLARVKASSRCIQTVTLNPPVESQRRECGQPSSHQG